MKLFLKACLVSALFVFILSPMHVMANNGCPEKRSKLKRAKIHVQGVSTEHNVWFMNYDYKGKRRSVRISYGDRHIFQNFIGETVMMKYWDTQFYDEHDGECVKRRKAHSIGGVKVQPGF